jgi:hypothetical protein
MRAAIARAALLVAEVGAVAHIEQTVPNPTGKASLIVIIGLFREFERGTNSVKRNLIEANPHTTFDVALFTDEDVCSSKDVAEERCSCMNDANAAAINSTATALYGSRLIHVQVARASSMGLRWQQSWPTIRTLAAARRYLIVLRPDVELTAPIDVPQTCKRHPGFNIISGDFERDFVFHNRDVDFGYLACSAATAELRWNPSQLERDGVHERGSGPTNEDATCCRSPPSLPTGFTGSWNACGGDSVCNNDVDCQVPPHPRRKSYSASAGTSP